MTAKPDALSIVDFLERHWPPAYAGVNAIGNDRIPATNNAVEMVIRRFDQHYQNFCGFDSLDSAQRYLGVFVRPYRLVSLQSESDNALL